MQRVRTSNAVLDEWYDLLKGNLWINYFMKYSSPTGENWIDFEAEISRVIQQFDRVRKHIENGESSSGYSEREKKVLQDIKWAAHVKKSDDVTKDIYSFDNFIFRMEKNLNELIRALEIYLTEFVGKINVDKKVPEIEGINPDHILSFNYTDTYTRVYGNDKEIIQSYIHGEADILNNVESNNMVLGIDEYLEDDRKDKEFTFLSFKKFYQRLLKQTDNKYCEWIDRIKDGYDEAVHTLYIFGHSLDSTDRDILKLFIGNDNVQTKIFYYRENQNDKSVLGKLITNLISIMGSEELIRRTGGAHKTIEFIPQTIMDENLEKEKGNDVYN